MTAYLVDGIKDVLCETALSVKGHLGIAFVPLLLALAVELVTPQSLHDLGLVDLEHVDVHASEVLQGERPAVESSPKPNSSVNGGHLQTTNQNLCY